MVPQVKGERYYLKFDLKLCKSVKYFNGPVKYDVIATSGIRGWLQTKQTASLYRTDLSAFSPRFKS